MSDFDEDISDLRAQRSQLLLRYLTIHGAIGALVGIALAAALVLLNISGIGDLAQGRDGTLAVGLMAFFFASTFSSAAMGVAVMSMHRRHPPKPTRRVGAAAPASIRARR